LKKEETLALIPEENVRMDTEKGVDFSPATFCGFRNDADSGHGFDVVYRKTDGGHTWDTWREHLNEFAPQRFG